MSVSVFAERLRNAMNSRGLKQVDLVHAAEHRGVKMGKSHISQYVAGKTMPREDVLEFLASELDVDMNWLRGEESTTQLNSDASNSVTDGEHAATPLATGASKPQTDSEIPVGRRRTFGKSHKLDNVLYDVRGPVADEAMRMEANGTHILKLNIGNPAPFGFRTPDEVVYDMAHQLTDTEGYSPSKGLFSARKAIMQYAQLKNIPNVTIDDIYTGNGVSELINLSMSALLDTGDEVLVPSPDYPLWTACVNLAGGTAVHYLCDEQSEWYPDIDDIRSKITSNTKAIVIINPNNPTGALYPKEVLQQIVDIAREHQLIIFSDEIYDRLVMDGLQHISIASMAPDLFCVTFSGLPHRLDDSVRQQAHCQGLHRGPQHARQHAHVFERARPVRGADRARRPPERQRLHRAGRPRARPARPRLRHAQPDPRHHRRQAEGRVLHLPEDRRQTLQHPLGRAVRARPAA